MNGCSTTPRPGEEARFRFGVDRILDGVAFGDQPLDLQQLRAPADEGGQLDRNLVSHHR